MEEEHYVLRILHCECAIYKNGLFSKKDINWFI